MTKFVLRWVINAVALYLAVLILPGIDLRSDLVSILWLALIFGLVNALFRPLIQILTSPPRKAFHQTGSLIVSPKPND